MATRGQNNFAHLRPESPFYRLFERGMAPIRNILVPRVGDMIDGGGVQEFYDLDVARCSDAQVRAIAEMVAKQCGGGTAADVEAHMRQEGFIPIRAMHVSGTSSDSLAFL